MSRTVRVGRGRAAVTITGPTAQELEDAVRRVLGDALDVLHREAEEIHANVRRKWPVKTGQSRDSWEVMTQIDPEKMQVSASIGSPLRYVRYIRTTKEGRRNLATRVRSPLVTEIRRPLRKARKLLIPELEDLLAEALRREVSRV